MESRKEKGGKGWICWREILSDGEDAGSTTRQQTSVTLHFYLENEFI